MDVDSLDKTISSDEIEVEDAEVAPHGWTKEETFQLLQAFKDGHSNDMEKIRQTFLPSKSVEEIKDVIAFYRKKASNHPLVKNRLKKARKPIQKCSEVPLAMWAKLLTDTFSFKELDAETATAVRMIAELDHIPPKEVTGGVDFRAVYHAIANAMEGKPLPSDKMVNAVLEKCVIEAAHASKAFIRGTSFRNVINDINLADKEMSIFPRPTENHELATLRHLSSQRKYNPLNIAETYLKPSMHNYEINNL